MKIIHKQCAAILASAALYAAPGQLVRYLFGIHGLQLAGCILLGFVVTVPISLQLVRYAQRLETLQPPPDGMNER